MATRGWPPALIVPGQVMAMVYRGGDIGNLWPLTSALAFIPSLPFVLVAWAPHGSVARAPGSTHAVPPAPLQGTHTPWNSTGTAAVMVPGAFLFVTVLALAPAPAGVQASTASASPTIAHLLATVAPDHEGDASCSTFAPGSGAALREAAREAVADSNDARLHAYRLAERAARCADDLPLLGRVLSDISDTFLGLGRYADAESYGRASVAIHEQTGDGVALAEAWNRVGNALFWLNRSDDAVDALTRGYEIAETEGDAVGQGRALNNLALVYKNRGELDQALTALTKAAAIFEAAGDTQRLAVVLNSIGNNHFLRGDYPTALRFNARSMDLNRVTGALSRYAANLDLRGNVYRGLGAYTQALSSFEEALALRVKIRDVAGRRETIHNIGLVHFSRGDYESAIVAYKRGLALNAAENDLTFSAEALRNIGAAAFRLGQRQRARANFEASLAIVRRMRLQWLEGELLNDLGELARADGRLTDSARLFSSALDVRRAIPDHAGEAESLSSLAVTQLAQGRTQSALARASEAADLAGSLHQREVHWRALSALGNAQFADGRRDAARASLREAVAKLESLSADANLSERIDRRFFEDKLSPYQALVALEAAEQHATAALAMADRAKARVLDEMRRRRTGAASGSHEALSFIDLPFAPDASAAVIEYAVSGTQLYTFVLTRAGAVPTVRVHRTTVPDLARRTRALRDQLAARDYAYAQSARGLFDLLLAPVLPWVGDRTNLVVVPDGPLWEVPFQALASPSGYVVERYAVSYAPSLSVLATLAAAPAQKAQGPVLALGKDDFADRKDDRLASLHTAEMQAAQLRDLYGPGRTTMLVGAQATESQLRRTIESASIVHLATHGVLNDSAPLTSFLALSPGGSGPSEDGRLEAWEMAQLTLTADLVVLAACDTARGRIATGEGVVGTMWALLASGARAVVVSQSAVEEQSAAAVLLAFHRETVEQRGSKAARLRDAQLALLRRARTSHPYYWAGFILVGDGA